MIAINFPQNLIADSFITLHLGRSTINFPQNLIAGNFITLLFGRITSSCLCLVKKSSQNLVGKMTGEKCT